MKSKIQIVLEITQLENYSIIDSYMKISGIFNFNKLSEFLKNQNNFKRLNLKQGTLNSVTLDLFLEKDVENGVFYAYKVVSIKEILK